jgi:hypothetical protein
VLLVVSVPELVDAVPVDASPELLEAPPEDVVPDPVETALEVLELVPEVPDDEVPVSPEVKVLDDAIPVEGPMPEAPVEVSLVGPALDEPRVAAPLSLADIAPAVVWPLELPEADVGVDVAAAAATEPWTPEVEVAVFVATPDDSDLPNSEGELKQAAAAKGTARTACRSRFRRIFITPR